MQYHWHRHTIAEALEQIRQGETPWVAIGDFLDDWNRTAIQDRLELASQAPLATSIEERQWAAVCAACVEHLCMQDHLKVPSWVSDSQYILPQPWYIGAKAPAYKQWLEETSLPSFKARNVMAGDRVLLRS